LSCDILDSHGPGSAAATTDSVARSAEFRWRNDPAWKLFISRLSAYERRVQPALRRRQEIPGARPTQIPERRLSGGAFFSQRQTLGLRPWFLSATRTCSERAPTRRRIF